MKLLSLPPRFRTGDWAREDVGSTRECRGGDSGGEDNGDDVCIIVGWSCQSSCTVRGDEGCTVRGDEGGSRGPLMSSRSRYGHCSSIVFKPCADRISRKDLYHCITLLHQLKEYTITDCVDARAVYLCAKFFLHHALFTPPRRKVKFLTFCSTAAFLSPFVFLSPSLSVMSPCSKPINKDSQNVTPPTREKLTSEQINELRKAMCDLLSGREPRDFQVEMVQAQEEGRDALCHAATGSRKTAIAAGPYALTKNQGRVTFMVSPLIGLQNEMVRGLLLSALDNNLCFYRSRPSKRTSISQQ